MILGQGTASTDEEILAEFAQFHAQCAKPHSEYWLRAYSAPSTMCRRIGKPIRQWSDEDILSLYENREKAMRVTYNPFIAFLLFRGYHRPKLSFLMALPTDLSLQWSSYVLPYRQKIEQTTRQLGYVAGGSEEKRLGTGNVLTLFIWTLLVTGKSLEELTRADFNPFRDEYQHHYRQRSKKGRSDGRMFRLEKYLIHWKILPPEKRLYRHEEHFAKLFPSEEALSDSPFREAILMYMKWSEAKYESSTIHSKRASLLRFFLWLQEHFPTIQRLDDVSRQVAISYAEHLKQQIDTKGYSRHYTHELYNQIRYFFDFLIEERLETAPSRNPFSRRDVPKRPGMVPRYLTDQELRALVAFSEQQATLFERTLFTTLLHTGIRAMEFAQLKASDIVQVGGKWRLHIHEGKGLKDRVIPLTSQCVQALQQWEDQGWERVTDYLFTRYGLPWKSSCTVSNAVRQMGLKAGVVGLTAHRFRHTFAVSLLNYGIRESALQKLLGHATLEMTLEYARILDETVERSFKEALDQMHEGAYSWVPNFFTQEDYTFFAEGDSVSWIQLPIGFCRRNPKLHCESDVKCFLCERFCATAADLPRLQQMYERFTKLGLKLKADVVFAQIQQLQTLSQHGASVLIPTHAISVAPKRKEKS